MAACGCQTDTCNCVIVAGDGAVVTGNGSPEVPYTIGVEVQGVLEVTDTPSIDHILTGDGTDTTPYNLQSNVRIAQSDGQLLSVGPDGLSVTCDDVAGCTAPSPPVMSEGGISGNGSVATPLKIVGAVPWPYACDETIHGRALYVGGTSGRLLTDPLPACVVGESALGGLATISAFCTAIPNNGVETQVSNVPNRLIIANPDPCRAMRLTVDMEGALRMDSDGAAGGWLNQLAFRLLIDNVEWGTVQRIGITGGGGGIQLGTPPPLITIPAGGSVQLGTSVYGYSSGGCHTSFASYQHPRIRAVGRTC